MAVERLFVYPMKQIQKKSVVQGLDKLLSLGEAKDCDLLM
jgi:hypothetical protein